VREALNKLEKGGFVKITPAARARMMKLSILLFILNACFHWLITEATRNPFLIAIRTNFRWLVDRIARIFPHLPGQCEETLSEHRQIIDALKARNPSLAGFVMREHMENAKKNLYDYLATREKRGRQEQHTGPAFLRGGGLGSRKE
jgi:DNA-binding GntR family transcriptional regulator